MIVARPIIAPPAATALNLGEKGGQAEVGVLRPDVEGVVVALGATNAKAEEPLGRQLGLDVGLDRVHRVVDRPARFDVGRVSHRGQERPDDFVPRLVLVQAAIDPGLVAVGPVVLPGRADLEQVAQLDPPEARRTRGWRAAGR